jgi:hypothetical protein
MTQALLPQATIAARDQQTAALSAHFSRHGLVLRQLHHWDVSYGRYTWNVDQALTVVQARPHPLWQVPPYQLAWLAAHATVDRVHVARVDHQQPGVLAVYFDHAQRAWQTVLIDGNHRACRAYEQGQPFFVYALSPVESWVLLLEHPLVGESIYYMQHLLCEPETCMPAPALDPPAPQAEAAAPHLALAP